MSTKTRKIPEALRKRIPAPGTKKVTPSGTTKVGVGKPTPPKPAPPKPAPKKTATPQVKEGKTNGTEKKKPITKTKQQSPARASTKATKPAPTAQHDSQETRPRPSGERAPAKSKPKTEYYEEGFPKVEGQLSMEAFKALPFKDMKELSKHLNKGINDFVAIVIRADLPKNIVFTRKEAEIRGLLPDRQPQGSWYCPYCVTYTPVINHTYSGYRKCAGCGTGDMDFHIRNENNLWK